MEKYSREEKFIAADGVTKLRVYANEGKRGINLGVTQKRPGEKTHVGCQETFETVELATPRFDALVAEARGLGWLPRPEKSGGRRSSFSAMPAPPAAAETPAPTGPVAVETKANGKSKKS